MALISSLSSQSSPLIENESRPVMSYNAITEPSVPASAKSHGSSDDAAHLHSTGSLLDESAWRFTPSRIMMFLSLTLAALMASLMLLIKPVPSGILKDGVGRLPAMGYNTWNAYHCDINATIILETSRLMKSLGLTDVGYTWMNIDDCYSEKKRNAKGDIVAHKTRFPSGMNYLTDQIHSLGMKAGIYSDSGWFTCQLYPGSFQNEARDVRMFQEWGFDYLKYDNCAVPFDDVTRQGVKGRYQRIAEAIASVSRTSGNPPMQLSLCQWGREQPWLWARRFGQSWRTTDDIGPHWDAITSILTQNQYISWASDFYGHNDMDILEVGNGDLTYEEAKTHFTAWALMKSPLLISAHLPTVSNETLEILTNHEIIAINQDPVIGTAVTPFRWGNNWNWTPDYAHPATFWSGESQNGTVFMLINSLNHPTDLAFNLTESPWIRAGRQYSVRDLWTHTDNGTAIRTFKARKVPAHGVVALLLQDAGNEPEGMYPPCAVLEWCMSENGTRIDQ